MTDFITTNSSETEIIDLSVQYQEISQIVSGPDTKWLGLEFFGDTEVPITVPATNTQGKYRETGAVYLHIVAPGELGAGSDILTRGEALRDILRGQRIESILIEEVTPLNYGSGATLQFEGGFVSASFLASYERDLDL
jgi:hypothetical protein